MNFFLKDYEFFIKYEYFLTKNKYKIWLYVQMFYSKPHEHSFFTMNIVYKKINIKE
jgi:hypothetical protein